MIHILKIPFATGGLNKTKGVEEAPNAILEQLKEIDSNETKEQKEYTTEDVKINNENLNEAHDQVFKAVQGKRKCLILGGNHALTYSAFKALENPNAGIIIFDAHTDCENNFSPPTHEDFLNTLISEEHVKPHNVIIIGTRNWHKNEIEFLKKYRIREYTMKNIAEQDLQDTINAIMEQANTWDEIYLSIDIDVIDPTFAPATGYPEPGGLTTREFLSMIQRIKKIKKIAIIDLVEVNPTKETNKQTTKLAAKIVRELL